MSRTLTLSLWGGLLIVVLTAVALSLALPRLAEAQGESCSLEWLDQNCNGVVDITDLFNVIDLYFSGDPIPATAVDPAVGGGKWIQTGPRLGLINSAEDGPHYGPWYLALGCTSAGDLGVFLQNVRGDIFNVDLEDQRELSLKTVVGTVNQPDTWVYTAPPANHLSSYLWYRYDESLVAAMLDADEMKVTTPYETPSTVTFSIGRHRELLLRLRVCALAGRGALWVQGRAAVWVLL